MGIKETTALVTDPLKAQQFQLQALQIKEYKNRWIIILISFILGFISNASSTFLTNMTPKQTQQPDVPELLQPVNYQIDLIQTLTNENTKLKLTLQKLKLSSDSLN
jgi:hypothetical protein